MPPETRRRPPFRIALIIAVLLVLLFPILGPRMWSFAQAIAVKSAQDSGSRRLQEALVRWDRRGPSAYRLTIEISGQWGECLERLEIQQHSVATIIEDGCAAPFGALMYRYMGSPMTVNDLFGYIKTGMGTRECGPNGCRCDGAIAVEPIYDGDLGYPGFIGTNLKRDWTSIPWPLSSESAQGCTLIGIILPQNVGVQVDPIP